MRMRTSMKMRTMITIKIEQILQPFLNNMPQYRPSPMRMKLRTRMIMIMMEIMITMTTMKMRTTVKMIAMTALITIKGDTGPANKNIAQHGFQRQP